MHIAILDEELPYPMTSGKRIRTLNLIQRLASRHRITYICHRNADPDEARTAARHFHELGIETVVVDRAVPPKKGLKFFARLGANLFSPLPYSVASHDSAPFREAVRDFAASHCVDLWHCEWTPYARASLALPQDAPWLVVAHNVESLIWQRMTETERNPVKRWYIRRQWTKYERFERWVCGAANRMIAVTPNDAELLREQFGAAKVDVVDNGVDTQFFYPTAAQRDPKCLLFLGSLDWRPNLDAVGVMLDKIFPAVRAFEPDARLLIVGRNPPPWLQSQSGKSGIEVHANVPDVRPFIAEAGLLAVPLRIGGGSRLKILEALSSGLPVVSTTIGAEGLDLEPGMHLDVVDSVDDMAQSLVAAIRNPGRIQYQAEAGRERVLARYDWDSLAERLETVWLECVCASARRAAA